MTEANEDEPAGCEAYPDGIPEATLKGKVDHKTPYPGDHGLTFLPRDSEVR